jgi:hypothetical protein
MLGSGPINPQSTASGLSPNATFVNSAALDTMGGERAFAAAARQPTSFPQSGHSADDFEAVADV